MQLRLYLDLPTTPRGEAARIAREIGVHPVMVSQWAGGKEIPVARCAPLERAIDGPVKRWDMRPIDWWVHWPELIGTEGAPDVPREEAAHAG